MEMKGRPVDWELAKNKLEIYQGEAGTEKLREKLVGLARNAITHVDASLAKVVSGETSLDNMFREDPSHDFNHTMRVLKLAENMSVIGGDIDVIRAGVLFHDVVTYSKNSVEAKTETSEAAMLTRDLLKGVDFPDWKINKVLSIIINTSFSKGANISNDEGAILYDADKLDQSGAIAIMRYFASGGQMNREFFNPNDPFLENEETKPEVFKYTIDALMDRLPKIAESIKIPSARQTARQRNEFFVLFLNELDLELAEIKKGDPERPEELLGVFQMMKVFGEAGKNGKSFYNQNDPFCEKREPQPEIYPLDALTFSYRKALKSERSPTINRKLEFFDNYFNELKYELNGEISPPPPLKITREIWEVLTPDGEMEDVE